MRICPDRSSREASVLIFVLLVTFLFPTSLLAQNARSSAEHLTNHAISERASNDELFRLERVPVEGGAELITIHARLDGIQTTEHDRWVPLVTVLRDTLGDSSPENDRLRYVWPLTYTRPTIGQRLSGAVPFLYSRVGSRKSASGKVPPPVLDLAATDRDVWNKVFWMALQSLLLDPYGMPVKASTRSYQQNSSDYRRSHIIRALSVLSLYEAVADAETPSAFSQPELAEIQARLKLTDKTFGGLVGELNLQRYNEQQITDLRDTRGHNWELLRQHAEAESFVFLTFKKTESNTNHPQKTTIIPNSPYLNFCPRGGGGGKDLDPRLRFHLLFLYHLLRRTPVGKRSEDPPVLLHLRSQLEGPHSGSSPGNFGMLGNI